MKRDMDLIRDILLQVEGEGTSVFGDVEVSIDGRSRDEVLYHVVLLKEAGFIEAEVSHFLGGDSHFSVDRLSWQGHEFLDTIRDPEIWRRTKAGAKTLGGASIDFVLQLGKAYGKQVIKEKLGFDLG